MAESLSGIEKEKGISHATKVCLNLVISEFHDSFIEVINDFLNKLKNKDDDNLSLMRIQLTRKKKEEINKIKEDDISKESSIKLVKELNDLRELTKNSLYQDLVGIIQEKLSEKYSDSESFFKELTSINLINLILSNMDKEYQNIIDLCINGEDQEKILPKLNTPKEPIFKETELPSDLMSYSEKIINDFLYAGEAQDNVKLIKERVKELNRIPGIKIELPTQKKAAPEVKDTSIVSSVPIKPKLVKNIVSKVPQPGDALAGKSVVELIKKLKPTTTDSTTPTLPASERSDLLEEIRKGKALKNIKKSNLPSKEIVENPELLKAVLEKGRKTIQEEEDEDWEAPDLRSEAFKKGLLRTYNVSDKVDDKSTVSPAPPSSIPIASSTTLHKTLISELTSKLKKKREESPAIEIVSSASYKTKIDDELKDSSPKIDYKKFIESVNSTLKAIKTEENEKLSESDTGVNYYSILFSEKIQGSPSAKGELYNDIIGRANKILDPKYEVKKYHFIFKKLENKKFFENELTEKELLKGIKDSIKHHITSGGGSIIKKYNQSTRSCSTKTLQKIPLDNGFLPEIYELYLIKKLFKENKDYKFLNVVFEEIQKELEEKKDISSEFFKKSYELINDLFEKDIYKEKPDLKNIHSKIESEKKTGLTKELSLKSDSSAVLEINKTSFKIGSSVHEYKGLISKEQFEKYQESYTDDVKINFIPNSKLILKDGNGENNIGKIQITFEKGREEATFQIAKKLAKELGLEHAATYTIKATNIDSALALYAKAKESTLSPFPNIVIRIEEKVYFNGEAEDLKVDSTKSRIENEIKEDKIKKESTEKLKNRAFGLLPSSSLKNDRGELSEEITPLADAKFDKFSPEALKTKTLENPRKKEGIKPGRRMSKS